MSPIDVDAIITAHESRPTSSAADQLAAIDQLTTALNRRTAQLRCLIRAAWPVLDSLEAIVMNQDNPDDQDREAIRECRELRDVLAVAELVK